MSISVFPAEKLHGPAVRHGMKQVNHLRTYDRRTEMTIIADVGDASALERNLLDRQCVRCHNAQGTNAVAVKFDLTPAKAYETLISFGRPSLNDQVWAAYRRGFSVPGDGIAQRSALWALLDAPQAHYGVQLDAGARERLLTWLDTYAQRLGHFSDEQERELIALRRACASLLVERQTKQTAAWQP